MSIIMEGIKQIATLLIHYILAKTIDFDPYFGAIGAILAHPDVDRVFCGLPRVH